MSDQNEILSDEQLLDYTQGKRKKLVEHLTSGGKIPDDRGDKMVLLSALDGMDKVSLTKIRIKAEDKQSDTASQATNIVARLLTLMVPKKAQHFDPDLKLPVLDVNVPDLNVIDGETALGTQNTNYETFSKQFTFD